LPGTPPTHVSSVPAKRFDFVKELCASLSSPLTEATCAYHAGKLAQRGSACGSSRNMHPGFEQGRRLPSGQRPNNDRAQWCMLCSRGFSQEIFNERGLADAAGRHTASDPRSVRLR